MTRNEFWQCLLRGQGRCILAVRENPEKYRDLVLLACRRRISYDTFSEGARTWFLYRIIACYDDPTPFVAAAAEQLLRSPANGDWTIFSIGELLHFFALDGVKLARKAMRQKYSQLYDRLIARKKRGSKPVHGLVDFHHLCVVMASSERAYLRIAEELGRLYRTKPFYSGADFDWLYGQAGKHYSKALSKAAMTSADIALYIQKQQEYEKAQEEAAALPAVRKKGLVLSLWLRYHADAQTVQQFADAYLQETEPQARAEALGAFCTCPFPGDPMQLIADAGSSCPALQKAAWDALKNIQHSQVREFALSQLGTDPVKPVLLLVENYRKEDAQLLTELVAAVPADFHKTAWHKLHAKILAQKNTAAPIPTPVLQHIYDTTYCSFCRNSALRKLGQRRKVTERMLQEALYDSNEDTRAYAQRKLNSRKL